MSDSRDQTGEQLGPYHLDRRYEDLDESGGQLYAAHHVDTGRPALVLVPETKDHWAPRSDWSVRVTSQVSPPFVATDLDRPPPPNAKALTDVDLVFIRMSGSIACVEDREDANADFTRPARSGSEGGIADAEMNIEDVSTQEGWLSAARHRTMVWGLAGAGTALAAGLTFLLWLWPHHAEHLNSCGSLGESPSFTDGKELFPSVLAYPMPETPFKEQRKPPCMPELEVEIHGGCWVQAVQTAPCPRGSAEYQGKCYVAVKKPDPSPSSVRH